VQNWWTAHFVEAFSSEGWVGGTARLLDVTCRIIRAAGGREQATIVFYLVDYLKHFEGCLIDFAMSSKQ
jgi:hypothetical protein